MSSIEPNSDAADSLRAWSAGTKNTYRSDLNSPRLSLTDSQRSSLFLLLTGGFAPLAGFMGAADITSTAQDLRLADGTFWPFPVVLEVSEAVARDLALGTILTLQDGEGVALASLHVTDVSPHGQGRATIGGPVEGIPLPDHRAFNEWRGGAGAIRGAIAERRWPIVMALVSSGFPRRTEFESTSHVLESYGGNLLFLPTAEMASPDDLDYFTRIRAYQATAKHYPGDRVVSAVLPLPSDNGGGLRNLLTRLVVARNYGATHFIVTDETRVSCPIDDNELAEAMRLSAEGGITMVMAPHVAYVPTTNQFVVTAPGTAQPATLATADPVEGLLARGEEVPEAFMFPEVARELRRRFPPRRKQGMTIFFTGLSGSGKSTIASVLSSRLMEVDDRLVTLLDGDLVRKHLTSELGFSREHRNLNVRRIGFVAREITKHGGTAICAPIAPYRDIRDELRSSIGSAGGFCLVFVKTSLEVCEQRDRKGLYAKARSGIIPNFTGVSDPYEAPDDADVVIDTTLTSPQEAVDTILAHLQKLGYLAASFRQE